MTGKKNGPEFQGWIATLGTGEVVRESPTTDLLSGKQHYLDMRGRGELSAWQTLLERIRLRNEKITDLKLYRAGRWVVAAPKADGYFQGYEIMISNNNRGNTIFQGVGAVFGDQVSIIWVDAYGNAIQHVRPLQSVYVHTNMRQLVDVL